MIDLWYADGPGSPRTSPRDAVAAAGLDPDAARRVTVGWTIEHHPWLDDPGLSGRTLLAGYALGRAVAEGRLVPLPVRFSAVPALIGSDPPDVAVVSGVRRGTGVAFGSAVGWADALVRHAARVVVEVDDDQRDLGAPLIEGNVVATVPRPVGAGSAATSRPADEIDLRIGSAVASLLPPDPTLQFGPGGIAEGIARAVDRPVRILTGLLTDAMATIHGRGLLAEPAVATYAWGGEQIARLAADGMLRLVPSSFTHDLSALAAIPRFVGCNTAVQVGLDGAVNVERVGGRVIASVGGHADYCGAAAASPGGMSIVALRSTTSRGQSTIVTHPEVVSTPRCDVDVVVTEHGVADLRGASDAERIGRLLAIAAPEHREALAAASS